MAGTHTSTITVPLELSRQCEYCHGMNQTKYTLELTASAYGTGKTAQRLSDGLKQRIQPEAQKVSDWFAKDKFALENYAVYCSSCDQFSSRALNKHFPKGFKSYLVDHLGKSIRSGLFFGAGCLLLGMISSIVLFGVFKTSSYSDSWMLVALIISVGLLALGAVSIFSYFSENKKLKSIKVSEESDCRKIIIDACQAAHNKLDLDSGDKTKTLKDIYWTQLTQKIDKFVNKAQFPDASYTTPQSRDDRPKARAESEPKHMAPVSVPPKPANTRNSIDAEIAEKQKLLEDIPRKISAKENQIERWEHASDDESARMAIGYAEMAIEELHKDKSRLTQEIANLKMKRLTANRPVINNQRVLPVVSRLSDIQSKNGESSQPNETTTNETTYVEDAEDIEVKKNLSEKTQQLGEIQEKIRTLESNIDHKSRKTSREGLTKRQVLIGQWRTEIAQLRSKESQLCREISSIKVTYLQTKKRKIW